LRHLLKQFIREAISRTPELPRRTVTIDDHKIDCEVADTDSARLKGLMHRQELQQGKGMLFVFPWQDAQSFWMRDTHIPLDIAFIDARGKILNIASGEPRSETPIKSVSPAMYVLEVPKGWFSLRRLEPGSIVSFGE
jgi:uncharacterized protein